MATFQLPPHVEALRYMMVEGGGDGRVMPPELVGEVMGYCGRPILRMDGPSEMVYTKDTPCYNTFKRDNVLYSIEVFHVGNGVRGARIVEVSTGVVGRLSIPSIEPHHVNVASCYYDSSRSCLFVSYIFQARSGDGSHLVGYRMPSRSIFLNIELPFSNFACTHAMAVVDDILYIAMRSSRICLYFVQWRESTELKLALLPDLQRVSSSGSMFLRAVPGGPQSVNLQFKSESVWHQVRIQMVRREPFMRFEAVKDMRVEAEKIEGFLVPVVGSSPPLHLSVSDDKTSASLRTQDGLKKVAVFDLGEESPPAEILADGRWTLGYYRFLNGTSYFVRFQPYVCE
ncbi:hypothetical protein FOZ63_027633 [Perkinsus olseni]|uniref:Uncharacterized protein n=1 Tax=Perkinsus olseni TaxID=32597 RepID=A0A7J6SJQ4_PEROL|nr:hypothetical protein FOZ63_027633 [Perkinsus olseni]KAF4733189.1 hypothetical protein FOZ62_025692 [Perkinsus olseni]